MSELLTFSLNRATASMLTRSHLRQEMSRVQVIQEVANLADSTKHLPKKICPYTKEQNYLSLCVGIFSSAPATRNRFFASILRARHEISAPYTEFTALVDSGLRNSDMERLFRCAP
jgi:hypothetical protein